MTNDAYTNIISKSLWQEEKKKILQSFMSLMVDKLLHFLFFFFLIPFPSISL